MTIWSQIGTINMLNHGFSCQGHVLTVIWYLPGQGRPFELCGTEKGDLGVVLSQLRFLSNISATVIQPLYRGHLQTSRDMIQGHHFTF